LPGGGPDLPAGGPAESDGRPDTGPVAFGAGCGLDATGAGAPAPELAADDCTAATRGSTSTGGEAAAGGEAAGPARAVLDTPGGGGAATVGSGNAARNATGMVGAGGVAAACTSAGAGVSSAVRAAATIDAQSSKRSSGSLARALPITGSHPLPSSVRTSDGLGGGSFRWAHSTARSLSLSNG